LAAGRAAHALGVLRVFGSAESALVAARLSSAQPRVGGLFGRLAHCHGRWGNDAAGDGWQPLLLFLLLVRSSGRGGGRWPHGAPDSRTLTAQK